MLTDFGLKDGYVAQMKAVISSLCTAQIIDITHDIQPHNIVQGAFILSCVADYFPNNTIFVAVVDPGVGTARKGIVLTTEKQIFVGPDNGLLIPAAQLFTKHCVYEITNKKYMQPSISNTFHGRDIFASVAAHLANGVSFDEIGQKTTQYTHMDFGKVVKQNNSIIGKILYIDQFGNCITNIPQDAIVQFFKYGDKIHTVVKDNSFDLFFTPSYGFVKKDELLVTIGSSNYVEISVNQGSAAKRLSASVQDRVELCFD